MTVEQARAAHAAEQISAVKAAQLDSFRQLARKLPSMLATLGLAQTLAFLRSKDTAAHGLIVASLGTWLLSSQAPIAWREAATTSQQINWGHWLQRNLAGCSSAQYYQALAESIAYAGWLKRLAEARALEVGREAADAH